jgi:hypothetical protein
MFVRTQQEVSPLQREGTIRRLPIWGWNCQRHHGAQLCHPGGIGGRDSSGFFSPGVSEKCPVWESLPTRRMVGCSPGYCWDLHCSPSLLPIVARKVAATFPGLGFQAAGRKTRRTGRNVVKQGQPLIERLTHNFASFDFGRINTPFGDKSSQIT